MITHAQNAMAQWQRIEALVQHWLQEREQLLNLLCTIRGMGQMGSQTPVAAHVQELCEVLMDYVSAGYFEIYRELAQEARSFNQEQNVVHNILQRLEDSTDEALAFNDDFDSPEHIAALINVLPRRVDRLLEKLEDRFALEDQLITSIHQRDRAVYLTIH